MSDQQATEKTEPVEKTSAAPSKEAGGDVNKTTQAELLAPNYQAPDLKLNITKKAGKLKHCKGVLATVRATLRRHTRPTNGSVIEEIGRVLRRYSILFECEQQAFDLWCDWIKNGTRKFDPEHCRDHWLTLDWELAEAVESIVVSTKGACSRKCDTTGWLNQRFAMVENIGGKCCVVEVANNEYIFHKIPDAKQFLENIKAYNKEGIAIETKQGRHMYAYEAWSRSEFRRTYKRINFDPRPAYYPDPDVFSESQGCLNLWRGFKRKPRNSVDVEPILLHMRDVMANSNITFFHYTISWLARMVQNPNRPAETAMVFLSKQGAGKNIFFDMITEWFGDHALTTTNLDVVAGQYNDIVENKCFIVLNEAQSYDKRISNGLKHMITEDTLTIHKKFHAPYRINNCSHLVFLSNPTDCHTPIEMDSDDRRYFICRMSDERVGDRQYFRELGNFISEGGSEAFLHYLQTT